MARSRKQHLHFRLVGAIEQWLRIRMMYKGVERIVEPQAYGAGDAGEPILRIHQVTPGPKAEKRFNPAKIEWLEVLDEHFLQPGPNYRMNDSLMTTAIYAQLDPAHPPPEVLALRAARRHRGSDPDQRGA